MSGGPSAAPRRWDEFLVVRDPQQGHICPSGERIASMGGASRKHYQFTAIDDCTMLRALPT
jgi:hypothetical protein